MTDEELLRVMKCDPKKMASREDRGPDGSSMTYSDDQEEIVITRSVVTGVCVLRHLKEKNVRQTWELGKP